MKRARDAVGWTTGFADDEHIPRAKGRRTAEDRTHVVFGTLYHEAPRDKPLHHVLVRMFTEDGAAPLGEALTGMDGSFEIWYARPAAWPANLRLRIFLPFVRYGADGTLVKDCWRPLAQACRGLVAREVSDLRSNCGTFYISCWERKPAEASVTPRLLVDHDHGLSQYHRPGRDRYGASADLTAALLFNPVAMAYGSRMPNETMQRRQCPKTYDLPESDEYLVDMVLNGFNPCAFKKVAPDSGKPGDVHVTFSLRGVASDGHHFAPDTTAYFRQEVAGAKLKLVGIEVAARTGELQSSPHASYAPSVLYSCPPEKDSREGQLWERAKRVFRCNYFLFGEVWGHMCDTHLNVEQYVLAVMRNLRQNPIFTLLYPHLCGTVAANKKADDETNKTLVRASPLTSTSIADLVHCRFKQLNWYGWQPRREAVTGGQHKYARLQQLYWDKVLDPYVTEFMNEHHDDIETHWEEIERMSCEIVDESVQWDEAGCRDGAWVCTNECNQTREQEYRVRNKYGQTAAVSPIRDASDVKQLCKYILMHATFKHGYVNDRLFDVGGDPDFASFGLESDILELSNNPDTAVSNSVKDMQRRMTYSLSNVTYGYLLRDEEGDIHPHLNELLQTHRDEFRILGLNVDSIRSCINT